MTGPALPIADCWNSIGVKGDRSCEKLAETRHCHNCPLFEQAAEAFLDRPAPATYAEEIATLLAAPAVESSEADEASVVLFNLGDQTLAFDTAAVVEVTEPRPLRRVPHRTNRVFLGLVNVRGQLELCASLPGLLQIEPSQQSNGTARMLLTERLGQRWVFAVDDVLGVQRLHIDGSSHVPATAQRDGSFCIQRLISWKGRQVGLLDLDKTFTALQGSLR
jgi:chemotaxis-related protein WspD